MTNAAISQRPSQAIHASLIEAFYRGILGREPDEEGFASHAAALDAGTPTVDVLRGFLASPEFLARQRPPAGAFIDHEPPLAISRALSPQQIVALWSRVAQTWEALGEHDPFWNAATEDQSASGGGPDQPDIDTLYRSGQAEVERLDAWTRRNRLALHGDMVCAEYGSGVGRVSIWLARRCKHLRCFDISAPHLQVAEQALRRAGIANAEPILTRRPHDLNRLAGIDLFVSTMVLQHNPPPLIGLILEQAFRHLRPGGLAFFQVPTYIQGYEFDAEASLSAPSPGLELHCLPQQDIFALAERHGLWPLEIEQDTTTGDAAISHRFLLRKTTRGTQPPAP